MIKQPADFLRALITSLGALILLAAIASLSAVPALAQPDPGEYGDAPEGGIAYPSLGVLGNFPTCIDAGGYYASHGPVQLAWFGSSLDFEPDGNAGLCGFPPYEMDECWGPSDGDAGILGATSYSIDTGSGQVVTCSPPPAHHIGDSCELINWGPTFDISLTNLSGTDCVVNVLIDWNRDGHWSGSVDCPGGAVAEEHAVVNWLVPDGYSGSLAGLGAPPLQLGPDRGYFWVRFSICASFDAVVPDWDGAQQFEFGETEDYLVSVGETTVSGELGDAPEDVIAYPLSGVTGHFPTCLGGPNGYVLHAGNVGAWFGPTFDIEGDGNATLCNFSLYDNDECDQFGGDAGLMLADPYSIDPGLNIVPCTASHTAPLGVSCDRIVWGVDIDMWVENHGNTTRWVNAMFDWDNNGHWGELVTCSNGDTGSEHVLRDFPVPGGYVGPLSALNVPGFQILRGGGYAWARFTISDQPVGTDAWDGQGTFGDGETEDYLFRISDGTAVDPVDSASDQGLILEPSTPNPFNPGTKIAFVLPEDAFVTVTIQDVVGRRVATLLASEQSAGRHTITWRGVDDTGRSLGSGIYFVQVASAGELRTGKLTMIK